MSGANIIEGKEELYDQQEIYCSQVCRKTTTLSSPISVGG